MHQESTTEQPARPGIRGFIVRNFFLVLSATITLTFLSSILVLAFQGNALATYNASPYSGLYDMEFTLGPMKAMIAGAGSSLGCALGAALRVIFVHRRGKAVRLSRLQRLEVFVVLWGTCILVLTVFLVSLIRRYRSLFDFGAYVCGDFAYDLGSYEDEIVARQCTDETAAMWIDLVLSLSVIAMTALLWKDWQGKAVLIRNAKSFDLENEYFNS